MPLLAVALLLLFASATVSMAAEEENGELGPHKKRTRGKGPIVSGPITGGKQDVTGSNDAHLAEVSDVSEARCLQASRSFTPMI